MLLGLVRLLIWGSRLGIRDVSVVALACAVVMVDEYKYRRFQITHP